MKADQHENDQHENDQQKNGQRKKINIKNDQHKKRPTEK